MNESITELSIRKSLRSLLSESANRSFVFQLKGETVSTNDDATKSGRADSSEGLVIVADHQTAGRGRRENQWESPPGRNLMFSLLLRPDYPPETWTRIPHLIGLAVARGIESAIPQLNGIKLKWPNDLILDGKKLGGILVESQLSGTSGKSFCVAGVGINVNIESNEFPESIRDIATTLYDQTGHIVSRSEILAHILAEWLAIYPAGVDDFEPSRKAIEQRSFLTGHQISVDTGNEVITGIALEIGPEGELRVENGQNITEIRAAERVRRVDSR